MRLGMHQCLQEIVKFGLEIWTQGAPGSIHSVNKQSSSYRNIKHLHNDWNQRKPWIKNNAYLKSEEFGKTRCFNPWGPLPKSVTIKFCLGKHVGFISRKLSLFCFFQWIVEYGMICQQLPVSSIENVYRKCDGFLLLVCFKKQPLQANCVFLGRKVYSWQQKFGTSLSIILPFLLLRKIFMRILVKDVDLFFTISLNVHTGTDYAHVHIYTDMNKIKQNSSPPATGLFSCTNRWDTNPKLQFCLENTATTSSGNMSRLFWRKLSAS